MCTEASNLAKIIICIIHERDHQFKTSANFHDFLPLPSPFGSFLLLSVVKFGHFLTPPPLKKCRRLKWMVPNCIQNIYIFSKKIINYFISHLWAGAIYRIETSERISTWRLILSPRLFTQFSRKYVATRKNTAGRGLYVLETLVQGTSIANNKYGG